MGGQHHRTRGVSIAGISSDEGFGQKKKIKTFIISEGQLETIPESIKNMLKLEELYINKNRLTELRRGDF